MHILEVDNPGKWPNLSEQFAQSWEWGEILKKEGKEVDRLVVYDNDVIIAQAQLVYNSLPFGWRYTFCPKGPVIIESANREEVYKNLMAYLKGKGCIFWRVEPIEILSGLEKRKTIDINPRATVILSLEKGDDELLQNMHPKTRYNIRLAEKKNLTVKNQKDFASFMKLMKQTGRRDKFKLHFEDHYKKVLDSEITKQITVFFENEPVATGVFVGAGRTFTYLYGASDYKNRNLMAPYLVQWEGIRLGKQLGYKKYDFFGVAPLVVNDKGIYEHDETHQYAGVTRFKLGFGGDPEEDIGTFDILIDQKKYLLYQVLRKLRRLF